MKDSHTVIMETPEHRSVSESSSENTTIIESNHQRSNKRSPSKDVSVQADFHRGKKAGLAAALVRSPDTKNTFMLRES